MVEGALTRDVRRRANIIYRAKKYPGAPGRPGDREASTVRQLLRWEPVSIRIAWNMLMKSR